SVRVDGLVPPPSSRATTACVVFMRRASCSWVIPARLRASIMAAVSENSSSSALYSRRYFGSFIQSSCRSSTRARLIVGYLLGPLQSQVNLPSWRLLGLLDERPHNNNASSPRGNV